METQTGRTATGLRSRDRQQDYTESKRQRVLQEDSEQKTGRKTTKSKRQRVLQEDKNKRQAERLQRVKDIHIVPGLGTRSFQKNATFLRSFRSS